MHSTSLPAKVARFLWCIFFQSTRQLSWLLKNWKIHYVHLGEELSFQKKCLWKQEQKGRVARLEKQLRIRWELDELIEEQLNRFHAHYNLDMVPTRLKDVAQLLMPNWTPPDELISTAWLGDWRPSAMLELVRSLPICSCSSSSSSSNSSGTEQLLSQLIYEIRIEEAIIDEEMAEIQSTCIFYLPFAPANIQSGGAALASVQSEFKKIERVITKAQQLRFVYFPLIIFLNYLTVTTLRNMIDSIIVKLVSSLVQYTWQNMCCRVSACCAC